MCVAGILRHWACCSGVWPQSKTAGLDFKKKDGEKPRNNLRIFKICAAGVLGQWACFPRVLWNSMATV